MVRPRPMHYPATVFILGHAHFGPSAKVRGHFDRGRAVALQGEEEQVERLRGKELRGLPFMCVACPPPSLPLLTSLLLPLPPAELLTVVIQHCEHQRDDPPA
eukprot:3266109-Rhodomonas_salina.2